MTKSHSSGDRHSGDGKPIHGEDKKGGAGKANWGSRTDEVVSDSGVNDPNDPNYEDKSLPKPQAQRQSFDQTTKEPVTNPTH
eukprot:CFRG7983T1